MMISSELLNHAIRFRKLEALVEAHLKPHLGKGLPSKSQWHLLRTRVLAAQPEELAGKVVAFFEDRISKEKTKKTWVYRIHGQKLQEWICKQFVEPIVSGNFADSPLDIEIDDSLGFTRKELRPHALRMALGRLIDHVLLLMEEKEIASPNDEDEAKSSIGGVSHG